MDADAPFLMLQSYAAVVRRIDDRPATDEPLAALVAAAVEALPNASAASVTCEVEGEFSILVSTGSPADAADAIQDELNHGPCRDAATGNAVFVSNDLAAETRWGDFGPRAVREAGTRSVMSVRILTEADERAALNVYSDLVDAFDDESVVLATLFATHAALALTAATAVSQRARADNLERALASNREIGVAMGVLMASYKLSRDDAFALLRIVSQNTNRKLRDVATEVADTGTLALPPVRTPRSAGRVSRPARTDPA